MSRGTRHDPSLPHFDSEGGVMDKDSGRVASPPGSRPSDQAASRPDATRVDPSRDGTLRAKARAIARSVWKERRKIATVDLSPEAEEILTDAALKGMCVGIIAGSGLLRDRDGSLASTAGQGVLMERAWAAMHRLLLSATSVDMEVRTEAEEAFKAAITGYAGALRSIQEAAALGIEETNDQMPQSDLFALIHRTAASALSAGGPTINEAEETQR